MTVVVYSGDILTKQGRLRWERLLQNLQESKHELAQLVAATESDMRVVEALKKRYSVEEWYK